MGKKILIIAAHPDDEVLGCGGVISKYAIKNEVCFINFRRRNNFSLC